LKIAAAWGRKRKAEQRLRLASDVLKCPWGLAGTGRKGDRWDWLVALALALARARAHWCGRKGDAARHLNVFELQQRSSLPQGSLLAPTAVDAPTPVLCVAGDTHPRLQCAAIAVRVLLNILPIRLGTMLLMAETAVPLPFA
jgi:hypothetical protein